jgi:hypothetical protein
MTQNRDKIEDTKRLIGALLRMPPKPHTEMKLGKKRGLAEAKPRPRSDQNMNQNRKRQKAPR